MNTITRDDTIHGVEYVTKKEAEREIAELNERLIDRQQTLMQTLIENQNLRRELDKAMHYNQ
jgi:Holliday junction resolvasome RuvABC DNA-binding subunit